VAAILKAYFSKRQVTLTESSLLQLTTCSILIIGIFCP